MVQEPTFFVDSNILVTHLRQKIAPTVFDKARTAYGTPAVSEIVVFEIEVGARRAGRKLEFQRSFSGIKTVRLNRNVLIQAAIIQADLLSKNLVIGLADTFIAATALHYDLPLFTLNVRHFSRVSDLQLLPPI